MNSTELNGIKTIVGTKCTKLESTLHSIDFTLMNVNKAKVTVTVDSILEPTSAVMDLDSLLLNCETHEC